MGSDHRLHFDQLFMSKFFSRGVEGIHQGTELFSFSAARRSYHSFWKWTVQPSKYRKEDRLQISTTFLFKQALKWYREDRKPQSIKNSKSFSPVSVAEHPGILQYPPWALKTLSPLQLHMWMQRWTVSGRDEKPKCQDAKSVLMKLYSNKSLFIKTKRLRRTRHL